MTDSQPTVDPVVLSTTSASAGDRSATPPIPGGARDGGFGALVMGLIWAAKALGVPIGDGSAMVIVGALFTLFTAGRKAWADSRVKHTVK
jgi:hypothetical protein